MKNILITVAGSVLVLFGLIWLASASKNDTPPAPAGENLLVAEETTYDFGQIRMADGKVRKEFTIRNADSASLTVKQLYTSCMCTSATLLHRGSRIGPFGMVGHGFIPTISRELAPGETAQVEVEFDPNAHGPAGVGYIERIVTVATKEGAVLELNISVNVIP